ncbi:GH25 family lysozyme [Companilactobacillus farciminis]|uniref:GH25 family lysozyme n=1 Tax=Companilactobacillus farciminis TaxID=1612 RepID=UPI001F454F06|nr:GH25 family lysozyme [Companilactobacillus farciminis]
MKLKNKLIYIVSLLIAGLFFCTQNVQAARTDMVDVSNHNGYMTVSNFQDMLNNYGVKSVVTKISEGNYYHDYTAANNISTAQQAGLYINGYHFARYTTVQGAINEADYAGQMAKADGLPIGSALITDVEAQEQNGLSRATNNANNQAFMNEVAKYGYRSAVYTMSSWLGSKMDVSQGWIASYPYDATGKSWYSSHHSWQWGSTYQFKGSYGNFDVSQNYDNFSLVSKCHKVTLSLLSKMLFQSVEMGTKHLLLMMNLERLTPEQISLPELTGNQMVLELLVVNLTTISALTR